MALTALMIGLMVFLALLGAILFVVANPPTRFVDKLRKEQKDSEIRKS